jgi:hypothetical protein
MDLSKNEKDTDDQQNAFSAMRSRDYQSDVSVESHRRFDLEHQRQRSITSSSKSSI